MKITFDLHYLVIKFFISSDSQCLTQVNYFGQEQVGRFQYCFSRELRWIKFLQVQTYAGQSSDNMHLTLLTIL